MLIITHYIQLNSFSAVTDFSAHVLGEILKSFESSLPKNPEQNFAALMKAGRALKIDFFNDVEPPEFYKGIFLQTILHEGSTFQDWDLQSHIG